MLFVRVFLRGSKNGSVVMMVGDVEACVPLPEVASQRLFQ